MLIAMFGALVYALFGLRLFLSSFASLVVELRDYAETARGGVGAVSFGMDFIDVFVAGYALLAIAAIVANRMLAAWAKASDSRIKALHRTQRWAILLAFVSLLVVPVGFTAGLGPLPFVMIPLTGVVWGATFVLTATLLGLYARTART